MKPIICSYASKGRENYLAGMKRLAESVEPFEDRYNTHFHNAESFGEPASSKMFKHRPHSEVPYLFKFTIIQNLREQGYTKIFWLDSSLVLNKDPMPLLESGVMAFDNLGHPLYKYISDWAMVNLSGPKDMDLYNIKQTWGGAIGFDFEKPKVSELFDEIIRQAELGSFNEGGSIREGFIAHRHDQAVMSVLFHRFGFDLHPYGKIVTHPHYLPPYEYGQDFYISHVPMPI